MTVNHRPKAAACRYDKAFRGMTAANETCHIIHKGPLVAVRAKAPPPLAEYETWLRDIKRNKKNTINAAKLRRFVIMRRQGAGLTEIAQATGFSSAHRVRFWLDKLPADLAA